MDGKSGTWYAFESGGFGRIKDVGSFSRAQYVGGQFRIEDP